MIGVEVIRDALVLHLGHDERARPGDEVEIQLRAEVDEGTEIEVVAGVAIQVEMALLRLVAQPGDVGGDGVAAGGSQLLQAVPPLIAGEPIVVDLT